MLHVTAGIAWIGASFYFVRLDLALRPPKSGSGRGRGCRRRVLGSPWRRPLPLAEVPPRAAPRCPSRCTGSSGRRTRPGSPASRCMVVLYYFDAGVRLVDPDVADLSRLAGDRALASAGSRSPGSSYDLLCRTAGAAESGRVGDRRASRSSRWRPGAASELFAARAAYLQVGAMLGTIMAANVLLVIIPAHRKLVAAMADRPRARSDVPLLRGEAAARCTTTTSRCRCSSRCSPATSRSRSGRTRPGSSSSLIAVADRGSAALLQPLAHRTPRVVDPRPRAAVSGGRARALAAARRGRTGDRPVPVPFAPGAGE